MKYKDSQGNWVNIALPSLDSMPVGTQVEYTGTDIPAGWEEVNDYSTTEIDTGKKWIDGKPIYRKVVTYSKPANEGESNISHNIQNLGVIINAYGYVNVNNSWRNINNFYSSDVSTYNQCLYQISDTTISIFYSTWYAARVSTMHIIMEYTKTTD